MPHAAPASVLLKIQQRIISMIVQGSPQADCLDQLCWLIESSEEGRQCLVLLLDDRGETLRFGAGPGFSEEARQALDGLVIGELAGSCGSAVYTGEPVLVADTSVDRRWSAPALRSFSEAFQIQSCWSVPFFDRTGAVLGSFSISHHAPRAPERDDHEWLKVAGELATLIVEHGRALDGRRRAEMALIQSQKMEAMGRLAGGMAHDFNNALGIIVGFGNLLRDELQDPDAVDDVNQILLAAQRASALTRRMLMFSRDRRAEAALETVGTLYGELQRLLIPVIGEDISTEFFVAESLPAVLINADDLVQVLLNLAINARHAMPEGGLLRFEADRRHLAVDRYDGGQRVASGEYVVLSVCDTGCGIDSRVLPHIFEPFFTTRSRSEGTGLGLSVAYGIIHHAGGAITVHSEVGRGTTFRIYLPVPQVGLVPQEAEEEVDAAVEASVGGTIMVVEDDRQLRTLARRVLEAQGYRVLLAEDGLRAMMMLQQEPTVQLVIADVILPGLSGPELIEAMQAQGRDLPVIYISGYSEEALAERNIDLSHSLILEKPYSPARLVQSVHQVLNLEWGDAEVG